MKLRSTEISQKTKVLHSFTTAYSIYITSFFIYLFIFFFLLFFYNHLTLMLILSEVYRSTGVFFQNSQVVEYIQFTANLFPEIMIIIYIFIYIYILFIIIIYGKDWLVMRHVRHTVIVFVKYVKPCNEIEKKYLTPYKQKQSKYT